MRLAILICICFLAIGCGTNQEPGSARSAAITASAQAEATQDAATKAGADAAAKEGAAEAAERLGSPNAAGLRGDAIVARRVADELDRRAQELRSAADAKAKTAEDEDRARESARADQARQERAWWIGMGGVVLGGLAGLLLWRLTTLREGLAIGGGIAVVGVIAAGYGAVAPWIFAALVLAALAGVGVLLWRQVGVSQLTATLSRSLDAAESARATGQPIHLERALTDLGTAVDRLPGARDRFKRLRQSWRAGMGFQEMQP